MRVGLLSAFVMVVLVVPVFGQHNYSIPVDNWTYDVIQQLQTRGYLLDLSPGFKPYRRLEVARALKKLLSRADSSSLPTSARWLIAKLDEEFRYEIHLVDVESANPDTSLPGARASGEAFLNLVKGDYRNFKVADGLRFRPTLRAEFGFDVGNHFLLYTDATVDQTLLDDTLYTGSTKFGLRALHQQAYVGYSDRYIDFTFGRDYLSWGYGNNGNVLLSTTAGALDLASILVKTSVMKFNWFVAQLDTLPTFTPDKYNYAPFGPGPTYGEPTLPANRYFTGSRFEFNIADKVFLGAFQAAVFGGPNAPIDLEIVNPLRITYEPENNDYKNLNAFLGADFSIFWLKGFNFYGDFMIDDWQVDHKTKGDLKPNLYSLDLGLKAADVLAGLGVSGTDANLQYMEVRNRVYNEYNWSSFEKLLLRNYPIANPYGDDFWNINLRLSHWINRDWKVGAEIMHLEHGSSNVWDFYTMPWLTDPNITVQTGYTEPFPYGTIQVSNIFQVSALYQPYNYLYGQASFSYSQNHNFMYVSGVDKGVFSLTLTLYYDFAIDIPFE